MFRRSLLVAGAVALVVLTIPSDALAARASVPLVAQADEKQETADDQSADCASATIVCVGKDVLGGAAGAAGAVIGSGADVVTSNVMDGVVHWAAEGAASLLNRVAGAIDRSTKPALRSQWFQDGYAAMVRLAIALAAVFLLLAAGHAVVRQQLAILLRALGAVPIAAILTFAAVTLVQLGLAVTDWMTASVLAASGDGPTEAFRAVAEVFIGDPAGHVAPFVVFMTATLISVLALAVWIELALREAAIYVAVAFMPLSLVAMVWRPTAVWCRRLSEALVAIILSKFALAVAFTVAAGALGEAGREGNNGGLSAVVAGGAVLLVAAISPWVLLRMLPMTQSATEHGINRQHVGGAARSAPGASMAIGATRTLMHGRFASGVSSSSSPRTAIAPGVSGVGKSAPAAADVPVAVIPNPRRSGERFDGSR